MYMNRQMTAAAVNDTAIGMKMSALGYRLVADVVRQHRQQQPEGDGHAVVKSTSQYRLFRKTKKNSTVREQVHVVPEAYVSPGEGGSVTLSCTRC